MASDILSYNVVQDHEGISIKLLLLVQAPRLVFCGPPLASREWLVSVQYSTTVWRFAQ